LSLSETIKAAIDDCGSIYQAAKACGVSHPVLLRFMSGQRDIRLETAERICEALGLELRKVSKSPKRKG
jgi:DNA-binding phage protein